MLTLYLDIDGVLLTTKHTKAAAGVVPFVHFITTSFACYWLTTHCKGQSAPALRYLSRFLPAATVAQLEQAVQPRAWNTLKTEALDVASDFYWLEDQPLQAEVAYLRARGVEHRLLMVDLNGGNTLFALHQSLQELLVEQDR